MFRVKCLARHQRLEHLKLKQINFSCVDDHIVLSSLFSLVNNYTSVEFDDFWWCHSTFPKTERKNALKIFKTNCSLWPLKSILYCHFHPISNQVACALKVEKGTRKSPLRGKLKSGIKWYKVWDGLRLSPFHEILLPILKC